MRRRVLAVAAALAAASLLAACSTVPSYKGGPLEDEPHAIVTPGERVSLWTIDGKNAWNHLGETYLSPGAHALKVRVEYTVEYEGEDHFEWSDVSLVAEEGYRYVLVAKPDGGGRLDLPPYKVSAERVGPIRGYGH